MRSESAASLYQDALHNLPGIVVLIFDFELRFQLVTGAGLDTQLLNQYAQPGRTLAETMPLAYGAAFDAPYRAALAGHAQMLSFIFMEQEYSIQVCPVFDDRGTIIAGMAVSTLIVSSAPTSISNRHRALVEQTNDAVFLLDLNGHPLEWNRRAAEMLGYDYADLPRLSIASVSPEDEMRDRQGRLARLAAGEAIPIYERRLLRKDGTELTAEINLTLVRDDAGNPLCIQSIVRDITGRKQAEASLRASEERYRMISELMSDFAYAFRVEPDGELIQEWITEDSFKRITGYTSEEVLNRIHLLYHPDDFKLFEQTRARTLSGERTQVECRIFTREGDMRWLRIDRTPLWDDAEGRVVRLFGIAKDITKHKEAELALRASEERYRLLSELTSDYAYAFRIEPDGRRFNEWITGSIHHATGYTAEELMGQGLKLIHPADDERVQAGINRAIADCVVDSSEYRIITKDGSIRWIRVARHPVWDETEGRVVRLYNVAQDITERKEAELALRTSEERYRMISELISDYAFAAAVKPDGRLELEWITGAFTRITGYPADAILDPDTPLMHPADRLRVQGEIQRALHGEHIERSEYRILTRNGETRWLQVDRHPVWDVTEGRVVRLYNVAQDVTRHKEAELALRASEERFRLVAKVISDGVYDWDMTQNISWHSDGYVNVFGQAVDHVSEVVSWYERIHPEDRAAVVEEQVRAIQGAAENWSSEYRMLKRDGEYAVVADRAFIHRDEVGRPLRLIGAVSDITARKAAEKQALDLAVQKEKVKILTDFVTAVSHDFRTPLSIINTSVYLLSRSAEPGDWQRHLDKVWEQVERIEQLVDGLLTMARLDRDNVLTLEAVDVNTLIRYIETRKRAAVDAKDLTLTLDLGADLPAVYGDRQWLYQALTNLVDNAVQFTVPGQSVTLRTCHDSGWVRVDIVDTGVGMVEEQLHNIFDPLYRAEAHRPTGHGPGLGLSIARKIVERHEGYITIDSAVNVGTTVRVFLPVRAAAEG